MTQEVLLTISGLHSMDILENDSMNDEGETIEVITPANYYWKNGKHYILYDEVVEGIPGEVKNRIKITGDSSMEIMKSGATNARLIFEKDKMNVTYYNTPYGQMQIGIHTRALEVNVSEDLIAVEVGYGLDINDEAAADCHISMNICPRRTAGKILA